MKKKNNNLLVFFVGLLKHIYAFDSQKVNLSKGNQFYSHVGGVKSLPDSAIYRQSLQTRFF